MTTPLPLELYVSMLVLGAALLAHGVWLWARTFGRPKEGPEGVRQTIDLVRGGRTVLTGLCLVGLTFGLDLDSDALITLSLVVGLEELYETTMAIFFLKRIESHEREVYGGAA